MSKKAEISSLKKHNVQIERELKIILIELGVSYFRCCRKCRRYQEISDSGNIFNFVSKEKNLYLRR